MIQLGGVGLGVGASVLVGARSADAAVVDPNSLFETRADVQAATIGSGIDVVYVEGYTAAGDGGGAAYRRVASEPDHDAKIKSQNGIWFEILESVVTPLMLGLPRGRGTDAAPYISAAIKVAHLKVCDEVLVPAGDYDCDTAIVPMSSVRVTVAPTATLYQRAAVLIDTPATKAITEFVWSGGVCHYDHATPSKLHRALDLKAHNYCEIKAEFTHYDDQIIHFIKPDFEPDPDPENVVANRYDLTVDYCRIGIWYQGFENSYSEFSGNGTQQDFVTTFPIRQPGDLLVTVLTEARGSLQRLEYGTDYTITSGGTGALAAATVHLNSAPAATTTVMMWPSQASGPKCPVSGNTVQLWLNDVNECGIYAVRYVDSEQVYGHIRVHADNAVDVNLNPVSLRNAETDFFMFHGVVMGANPRGVTDQSSVHVMRLGPGSNRLQGTLLFDRMYDPATGGPVVVIDTERVTLSGTVTATNNSATVVGTGTHFSTDFQTISTADRLYFADSTMTKEFAVASITDDTHLQLATAFNGATLTNVAAVRTNPANNVAYDFAIPQGGQGGTSQMGRARRKSGTYCRGTVTLPRMTTVVTAAYPHALNRAPDLSEIRVTPLSDLRGGSFFVKNAGATGFMVAIDTALTTEATFAFAVEFEDFYA